MKHSTDLSFLPQSRLESELTMWNSIRDKAETKEGKEHAASVAAGYQSEFDTRKAKTFKYTKVYSSISAKEADMEYLRSVLPKSVTGKHFKDIAVLDMESDVEIDFEAYGSPGWELDQE